MKTNRPVMPKDRRESFVIAICDRWRKGMTIESAVADAIKDHCLTKNAISRVRNASIAELKKNSEWSRRKVEDVDENDPRFGPLPTFGNSICKAKYTTPCIHCGHCCRASLCPLAEKVFPGSPAPCPGIFVKADGTFCELVLLEESAVEAGGVKPLVTRLLGIGCGCSNPDSDTTDDQIEQFDKLSYLQVWGKPLVKSGN